jgi:hypothetical protein
MTVYTYEDAGGGVPFAAGFWWLAVGY